MHIHPMIEARYLWILDREIARIEVRKYTRIDTRGGRTNWPRIGLTHGFTRRESSNRPVEKISSRTYTRSTAS